MAGTTLDEVRRFIKRATISVKELDSLAGLITEAKARAVEREQQLSRAVLELDVLARNFAENCGIEAGSTRELLDKLDRLAGKKTAAPSRKANRITGEIRKPYLNPFDPSELFFLAANRPVPDWAQKLFDQGWDRSELHFKRIATALKARGLPVEHNYPKIHQELVRRAEQGE